MIPTNKESTKSIEYIFEKLYVHGVDFWLDAGTLLKGLRDGDLYSSSDIDLAIEWNDYNRLLSVANQLGDDGYEVIMQNSLPFLEDLLTIILPEPINKINSVDIYIYHKFDGYLVRRSVHKPVEDHYSAYLLFLSKRLMVKNRYPGGVSRVLYLLPYRLRFFLGKILLNLYDYLGVTSWHVVPEHYFHEKKQVKICEISLPIPCNSEQYLEYRYGKDWMIPIKREDWFENWKRTETNFLKKRRLRDFSYCERYWQD